MIVQRRQIMRKGHRPGAGRLTLRLRRSIAPLVAAPVRHHPPEAVSEPFWLMESDMSDEQYHQDHQEHYEQHGDYTPQPEHSPDAEQPPVEQSGAEAPAEAEAAPEAAQPDAILARLDAIDASLAELRAGIEQLKAARAAEAAVEPAVVAEPMAEIAAIEAAPVEAAVAAPETASEPAPAVDHGHRFDALEAAISELRGSLGQVHADVVTLSSDVADHRNLHAATQAMIDEQQNLMRGLNYIITSAIGTLTAAAKPGK